MTVYRPRRYVFIRSWHVMPGRYDGRTRCGRLIPDGARMLPPDTRSALNEKGCESCARLALGDEYHAEPENSEVGS